MFPQSWPRPRPWSRPRSRPCPRPKFLLRPCSPRFQRRGQAGKTNHIFIKIDFKRYSSVSHYVHICNVISETNWHLSCYLPNSCDGCDLTDEHTEAVEVNGTGGVWAAAGGGSGGGGGGGDGCCLPWSFIISSACITAPDQSLLFLSF